MIKNVLKFSLEALSMVLMGIGFLYVLNFLNPEYQETKEAKRLAESIKQQYQSDLYGGYTPEETLQLFIDALKKDDINLAAKYMILEKQFNWRKRLSQIKEKRLLNEIVNDFEQRKFDISDEMTAHYVLAADTQASPLILIKAPNGRWKISNF